jgi:chromosomal replication initiation ATPase DnaA
MEPIQNILEQTAQIFGRSTDEITGRSRRQPIVEARQAAMWAIRQRYPSISLEGIGGMVGGRHYTTVMHALAAVEQRASCDAIYADRLQSLLTCIRTVPAPRDTSAPIVLPRTAGWWLRPAIEECLASGA